MRKFKFNADEFIRDYYQAKEAGLRFCELAEVLGLTSGQLAGRLHRLRKRGVNLPSLRRAAKPMLRLTGPAAKPELHFSFLVSAEVS